MVSEQSLENSNESQNKRNGKKTQIALMSFGCLCFIGLIYFFVKLFKNNKIKAEDKIVARAAFNELIKCFEDIKKESDSVLKNFEDMNISDVKIYLKKKVEFLEFLDHFKSDIHKIFKPKTKILDNYLMKHYKEMKADNYEFINILIYLDHVTTKKNNEIFRSFYSSKKNNRSENEFLIEILNLMGEIIKNPIKLKTAYKLN